MRRGQRTQIHVVVDVDVAPFPSREDLTIGFAHVAYRAEGNSPRGRATSRPSGDQTLEKLERRPRQTFA